MQLILKLKKGSYIYEFSDRGSTILLAPYNKETTFILATFDGGFGWHKIELTT